MSKKKAKSSQALSKVRHGFKGRLSLIIPCYNESNRIAKLRRSLLTFDKKWDQPLEIIVVNDGSTDDTAQKIEKDLNGAFSSNVDFQFINLEKNQGKGGALKAGVAAATGDYLLTLDADMATSPTELFAWMAQLPGMTFPENKILIGSREHGKSKVQGNLIRRVAGLIFNFIIQLFTNLHIADTQCGFKLYPAEIGKKLFQELRTKGWAHDVELLYAARQQGIEVQTMPVAWEHQEDSKIALFSDSLKMLGQTILISTRLKWRHFIVQPIKDLRQGIPSLGEPSWYRLLFVLATILLLFLMPKLSFDFGITGDEEVQKIYGEKILSYFETDGEDKSALDYKNLYYYGGLFDYSAAWLNKHVGGLDVYEMRHLLNAFVGFLMLFFTGLLAREVSQSWRIAFFALLFMALSPRIFGHSMNNPKDIPFAAAYVFSLLHMVRFLKQLPNPGSKTIVMLIIGIAAAINVRVGGILLIAYFGLFVGLSYLLRSDLRPLLSQAKPLAKIIGIGLLVAIASFFLGMLFWPYALQAPLSNPFKALSEMSNFSTSIRMLFEGTHMWSDELPWYYIPKWVAIASPIFTLVGLLAFTIFYALKWRKVDALSLLFILFTAVFPVAYAIIKDSSLYDGMRHFLFIYPMLIVLAAWGWNQLIDLPKMRWVGSAVLALLVALPAFWMVKNHPYQSVYFNELAGGIDNAYGRYETDYWMNSVKEMSEWLIENEPKIKNGEDVIITTNCYIPAHHYMKLKYDNARVRYTRYNDRHKQVADYHLMITRFVNKDLMKNTWPLEEVVYTVKAGNTILGAITKIRDGYQGLAAAEAEKARNFSEAARLYDLETKANPKDETAWLGLANARMQLGDFENAKTALDGFTNLSDTHVNGQFALALYYLNTGKNAEAKATLERLTKINYKYNASYFYLSRIYVQENQIAKAMEALEMYDETGGNQVSAYDMAIQIAKQTNARAKELYFSAKKAYFQQKGGEAVQLVKQAIAVDPNYEPAVKLNKQFEEILAKQREEQQNK